MDQKETAEPTTNWQLIDGLSDYPIIHPASRGVAAHTAGLFRSVRGAKNFHFPPPWGLPKLGNFHFSPPWGLPKLGNFHFSPRGGFPS